MSELMVRFNEVQFILGQWRWIYFLILWAAFAFFAIALKAAGKPPTEEAYSDIDWSKNIATALLPAVISFRLFIF